MPWWDHAYCFEQPLLDLASGSFPTGLCQDPEIDLPAVDFKPRSKLDAEVNARCKHRETLVVVLMKRQMYQRSGEMDRSDYRSRQGDWKRRRWLICFAKSKTL